MKNFLLFTFLIFFSQLSFSQTPVFSFPFNGNTLDESGNNNHAENFGATLTEDRFGNPNSAYYFNGNDAFMEIPPIADLASVGDFTICVWVKHESFRSTFSGTQDRQMIFCGNSKSRDALENEIMQPGPVVAYLFDSVSKQNKAYGGIIYDVISNNNIKYTDSAYSNDFKNSWHFIVYGRDGQDLFYFIDNQEVYRYTDSDQLLNMDHNYYIGDFAGNNPNYFLKGYSFWGAIDDLKFFSKAISSEEIFNLYKYSSIEPFKLTYNKTNESYLNSFDGSIDINISGGTAPYSYIWSNTEYSKTISNLTAGKYTIKIIDFLGNSISETIEIETLDKTNFCSISGSCTFKGNPQENTTIYLFEKNDDSIKYISSVITDKDGYYSFNNLFQGKYITYSYPEKNLLQDIRPSYYYSNDILKEGIVLDLKQKIEHVNIKLKENNRNSIGYGEATIYISNDINSNWISPFSSITLLCNDIALCSSDISSNKISFDKLPYGSYSLYIENPLYGNMIKEITVSKKVEEISLNTQNREIQKVKIYPNPCDDYITISSDFEINTIIISSHDGKEISSFLGNKEKAQTIKTESINPGIYTVKINNKYSIKLIKK